MPPCFGGLKGQIRNTLFIFKALYVQSGTLPCFYGFPRPIWNASNPEHVQSGTPPILNAFNLKRVRSIMRLIWNASTPKRVPKPPQRRGPLRGLANDHVISGPMVGLKSILWQGDNTQTLQLLDWLVPEGHHWHIKMNWGSFRGQYKWGESSFCSTGIMSPFTSVSCLWYYKD